jgi:hypothetical protein
VKDEDDSLLEGLDDGEAAAAGDEDDKALLQGLSQEDGSAAAHTAAAPGTATEGSSNGPAADQAAAGSNATAAAVAPGMRVRPSGPSAGDQKYAAGVAARAVQLLQQWSLLLPNLLAGFAAQHPEAHAALSQVRGAAAECCGGVLHCLVALSH